MNQQTARLWLEIACGTTAAVGVGMALLALPAAMDATAWLSAFVFGEPGGGGASTPLARLLAAISGGVLAGWAISLWVVVRRIHDGDPGLVRAILVPGLLVWFVIDSTGSLISGGGINVIGNVGFLVLFGVPLVAARAPRKR